MGRKHLLITIILFSCLFVSACGNNIPDKEQSVEITLDTQATHQQETDTHEVELSELEKKIQEFENKISSEITITQDVLRGKWMYGNVLHFVEEEENSEKEYRKLHDELEELMKNM